MKKIFFKANTVTDYVKWLYFQMGCHFCLIIMREIFDSPDSVQLTEQNRN